MSSAPKLVIVVNSTKEGASALAGKLETLARSANWEPVLSGQYPLTPDALEGARLCLVIGGDGTLLGTVEAASASDVPVVGVNLGRLGFMASFSPEDITHHLSRFLAGELASRRLSVMRCQASNGAEIHALNDVVVKGRSSRLVRLEVCCESERVNTYHADGVIFSTPTGSTAYNLSAGGPIIHPLAKVLAITPINPHTLSNRSIVLDDSHVLKIRPMDDAADLQISADGRPLDLPENPFPIQLTIARDRVFTLVQPEDYSHYFVLRNKLLWNGDAIYQ
jgi:NAD+ kinase